MTARHTGHHIHEQSVMIDTQVHLFKDRCTFKLRGRHFVMPRAQRNTKLVSLPFIIPHERVYSFRNGTKIVVFELLTFCGAMTKHSSAAKHKIRPCIMQSLIDDKIFLLPSKSGSYPGYVLVEIIADIYRCPVQCLQCF